MIRATTPEHRFLFDVDPEQSFKSILVTYSQGGKIILEKEKEDLHYESTESGWEGSFRLSQEDTKKFSSGGGQISVQVRALTYDGIALAGEKSTILITDVLNDKVLE